MKYVNWIHGTWIYRNGGSGVMHMPKMFWIHPANRSLWRRVAYWFYFDIYGGQ